MSKRPRIVFQEGQHLVIMKCGNCDREVFNVTAHFLFCQWKRKIYLVGELGKPEKCWNADCGTEIHIPKIFRNLHEAENERKALWRQVKLAPDIDEWFPFVKIIPENNQKAITDTLTVFITPIQFEHATNFN